MEHFSWRNGCFFCNIVCLRKFSRKRRLHNQSLVKNLLSQLFSLNSEQGHIFRNYKVYAFWVKISRSERLKNDRFLFITDVLNTFKENCFMCSKPEVNISVDEQLFPPKTRCRILQYILINWRLILVGCRCELKIP